MASHKSAAVLTIFDGARMTKRGCDAVADWLVRQARWFRRHREAYSGRFTARYLYKRGR